MKVHFDNTNGTTELVITPETEVESTALKLFGELYQNDDIADIYHNIILLTDKD